MKLYRLSLNKDHGSSGGFEWFTANSAAVAAGLAWAAEDAGNSYAVDHYDFPLTKAGVIELLIMVATHADNG